jgi:hypothetical protein
MRRLLVDKDLVKMWKEAGLHWFAGLLWIFCQGLRKTAKVLSHRS